MVLLINGFQTSISFIHKAFHFHLEVREVVTNILVSHVYVLTNLSYETECAFIVVIWKFLGSQNGFKLQSQILNKTLASIVSFLLKFSHQLKESCMISTQIVIVFMCLFIQDLCKVLSNTLKHQKMLRVKLFLKFQHKFKKSLILFTRNPITFILKKFKVSGQLT